MNTVIKQSLVIDKQIAALDLEGKVDTALQDAATGSPTEVLPIVATSVGLAQLRRTDIEALGFTLPDPIAKPALVIDPTN